MNSVNITNLRRSLTLVAVVAAATSAVTGCSSNRPPDYQAARNDNGYTTDVTTAPTVGADIDTGDTKSSSPLANTQDPLVQAAGDPLARGAEHDNVDSSATSTPLEGTPTAEVDPLTRQDISSGTEHSHWLRGSVVNARVEVQLNSVRLTDLFSNTDKDITSNCRKGLNTITFIFKSNGVGGSAALNVLESEHDPPIAPLVTFNTRLEAAAAASTAPLSATPSAAPKTMTKTFTFIAQ